MNKIKVIDLLNMISKGEEVPKKIKWGVHELEWFVYEYKATSELGEPLFSELAGYTNKSLNDEVEIIEEEKEIEKIPFDNEMEMSLLEMYHQLEKYNYKINELIDVVNGLKRDKE